MKKKQSQAGFTLIELLISMFILLLVMGTAFELMNAVQIRKRVEEERVDILEESRDFVDELSRDLRNSGYPQGRMYACGSYVPGAGAQGTGTVVGVNCAFGANPLNSPSVAAGLVAVSATDILFEGDVNQDGTVDSVRYQLTGNAGPDAGTCPCSLFRSQFKKQAAAPTAQPTAFNVQVDNVINSGGVGNALPLAGTTGFGQLNDVYYATYKTAPIFTYYDVSYNQIAVPPDLQGGNFVTGQNLASQVRSIMITVNILAPTADLTSKVRPGVTMRTMVRVANN
jgi:prepilin-type N-terminal cleavage/methylation domain-containing protein